MGTKKIALIHPRLILRGGLESRLLNYMKWFSDHDCDVTVFCFKHDESIALPKNVTVHKFNMRWVPKLYRHRYFSHLLTKENIKEKFDLALSLGRTSHQHAVLGPGNHIGYLRASGRSAKSLSDIEQIAMDRKAYNTSGVVLAASGIMANEIIEHFGVSKNRVQVLFPPINVDRLTNAGQTVSKTDARNKLRIDARAKVLALVSTGNQKLKGVPFLLDLLDQLPNVNLIVAGSEVQSSNPNVLNLGFQEDPSLLYRAADVTVVPSIYEAFGQVVAESLVCGTPVLVSEMVGAKEILNENNGMVLPVGNRQAWTNAMDGLRTKPELSDSLIDITEYSVDTHMQRLCALVGLNLSETKS